MVGLDTEDVIDLCAVSVSKLSSTLLGGSAFGGILKLDQNVHTW